MNVCREIPGVTDKSTFGHPGRYTFCIAENEEASPWEPYHVEHGMSPESSAVGLFPACHPMEVFNQSDPIPEQILDTLSHTIAANLVCHGPVMLIMSPEHAQNIGPADGASKTSRNTWPSGPTSFSLSSPTSGSGSGRWAGPGTRAPMTRTTRAFPPLLKALPAGRRWRGRRPLHDYSVVGTGRSE